VLDLDSDFRAITGTKGAVAVQLFTKGGKHVLASLKDRVAENVPGPYYVDSQCIDCDVCRDIAPDNFTRSDENGYSYVFKQPENEQEGQLTAEALEACPVEAIGLTFSSQLNPSS
jgi:ferredoxin